MSIRMIALSSLFVLGLSSLHAASPAPTSPTATTKPTSPVVAAPSSPTAQAPTAPVAVSPSAAPVVPVAAAVSHTATAPASSPTASAALTPTAAVLSPTAAALSAPLSGTPDAEGDSLVAEEVGQDGLLALKTESPDLSTLDSETLAAIATGVDLDSPNLYFDPTTKQPLAEAAAGAWKVDVDPLYYELAKRTSDDAKDKSARQALALALFKDERAKHAKDLVFEDKQADAVIAQLKAGRSKAKADLQALADKGNRKARLFLGLDKAPVVEAAPIPAPVAVPQSPTAAVAQPASPSATVSSPSPTPAPVPQSGTATTSPAKPKN